MMVEGGLFFVDNYIVHAMRNTIGPKETLLEEFVILMLNLLPYSQELNPTELVFNTLLQRLTSVL